MPNISVLLNRSQYTPVNFKELKLERVAGIEPAHRPWQGCRLPLHHTRALNLVDRKRIELFPKACKAPVLPLSLTAHTKNLHQYIVFVKRKNKN